MKPHQLIPTCLLAAAIPLSAASISVNFGADRAGSAVDEAGKTTGAIPVAGDLWNNTTVNGGGTLLDLIDDSGTATTAFVDWTAANTWQSGSTGTTATSENGDLTKGYLDDGAGGWSVNLSSPYLLNDIYVIHATDQGDPATMSAVSVNGTYYKGDEAGGTIVATGTNDSWSAQNWTNGDTLAESTHYLKVLAQPGVNLGVDTSSPGRGAIAGVQVIDAYSGTLSYWDLDGATAGAGSSGGDASGNWADANWSTSASGEAATTNWTSGNAAVFSAGTDANGIGTTITLSGTENADALWVQEGNITLTGGTLALGGTGILRADDPSNFGDGLVVDSILTGTDVSTLGIVTLNNASNAVTGTVTVLGDTILGANNTWGQVAGAGVLDLQGNTLTVGDASNSNFAGQIFGGVGSGMVKTGTGSLSVGDTLTQLDAVTISDGTLSLSGGGNAFWSLSGSGNLDLSPSGNLVLESTGNTFTGKTSVTGGILRIPGDDTLGTAPASPVADSITLNGGARIQGGDTAGADITLNANRGIILASGDSGFHPWTGFTLTVDGDITGSGRLTKTDGGTLVINGDVDLANGMYVPSGTATVNGNLNLTGGAIRVQGGATVNINSPVATVSGGFDLGTGTTNVNLGNGAGGTMTLEDWEVGQGGNNPHTSNLLAGDVLVENDIRIGHWGGSNSSINVSGGSLSQPDTVANPAGEGEANLFLGIDGVGTLTISGGTVNTTSLTMDGRGPTGGTELLALTGGTLNIGQWGLRSNGSSYLVQFGGGTVGTTSSSTETGYDWSSDWTSGVPIEFTGTNGNTMFDAGAHTIALTGALTGTGGLSVESGMLDLGSATSTFTGPVTVNDGELVFSNAAAVSELNLLGGVLRPLDPAGDGLVNATATVFNGGTATFRIGSSVDTILTQDLTVSTPTAINVSVVGELMVGAEYTVIEYTGTAAGVGDLTLTPLPNPRIGTSLVHDAVAKTISVKVDSIDTLVWTGAAGTSWNFADASWDVVGGGAAAFLSADSVLFDGATPGTITLDETLDPAQVTVDTILDYTFGGTGGLAGNAQLIKNGSGTLQIDSSNAHLGGNVINAGLLRVGSPGALGAAGSVTQVNSGATLDINGQSTDGTGQVVRSAGTIINSSTDLGVVQALELSGDTTVNLDNPMIIGADTSGSGTLNLGSHTLTKTGPEQLILNGVSSESGNITINEGSIRLVKSYNNNQRPVSLTGTGLLTLNPGTSLVTDRWATGFTVAMPIVLNGGTIGSDWPGPNGATYACPVAISAASSLNFTGGYHSTTFSGVLSGTGELTQLDGQTTTLTGNNTWSGGLVINGGTIRIGNGGTTGTLGTGPVTNNSTLILQRSDDFAVPNAIGGTGGLVKREGGNVTLTALNTYTGDTTIEGGGIILADGATLTFAPGANGVSNAITGVGGVILEGQFDLDLTGADLTDGNAWTLVDVDALTFKSYAATFALNGFTEDTDVHTLVEGPNTWTFTESTGVLSLAVVSDPYDSWEAAYGIAGSGRTADDDRDGLTNEQEYAFGLSPVDPASVNPITVPLNKTAGTFSYTRLDPTVTGLVYTVETSTTLQPDSWVTDAGATENVTGTVAGTGGDVQTVELTLTGPLGNEIYARVVATPANR